MKAANRERVEYLLTKIAEFGHTDKGITRLAYSPEDVAAQTWLIEQINDLQLDIRTDAVGNVFLRRNGLDNTLAPVTMGSHLDTVIQAGAYDGIVGVVGAIETLYMLADEKLVRPIEAIIFRAEESSRFGFATIGSKLMTGKGSPKSFATAGKKDDITFEEALAANGFNPDNYRDAIKTSEDFHCFFEMHIEQGKVLDETGEQIGIVHHIAAPTRFKIIIEGLADHSGATPMGFRKDALVAGAKMILAVENAAANEAANGTVATVGMIDVEPSSINVVPGKATLWVDLRGVEHESINNALQNIVEAIRDISDSNKVKITMDMLTADQPVALSEELAQIIDKICQNKNLKYRHMNSGAGHDAMHLAKLTPTSMIFVPCKDGISHNPAEFAKLEDICLGIEVLAEAVKIKAADE